MTPLPMRCPDCAGCALYEEHALGQVEPIVHSGMAFDVRSRQIHFAGRDIKVTRAHGRILASLLRVPGKVVSMDVLRIAAGGDGEDGGIEITTLRAHINHIRRSLIERHGLPFRIQVRWGLGYSATFNAELGEVAA